MDTQIVRTHDPWTTERFAGIVRPYTRADVERLRGSFLLRHTLSRRAPPPT